MSFQILAYITAGAACLLGLRFIFAGAGVLKEWDVEVTAGALILFRRLGVIYLGLAVIFLLGRNAAPSDFRSAMCLVMAGAVAVLASMGLFEFLSRRAGAGIFRSVVGEAVLSAAFIWQWWSGS
ncbi:hypothetical protein [Henriciella litoralis]|uniref:hypothetical protein n=1 Tax=Henriciella litoralis TaxID=568102 RepID=UPI000A04DDDE|nr:hypothetical protein [Henriciella litoralis]